MEIAPRPEDLMLRARKGSRGFRLSIWNRLQKGETIETDGYSRIHPDHVLGPPQRKGLKLTYYDGHPAYVASIAENAAGF